MFNVVPRLSKQQRVQRIEAVTEFLRSVGGSTSYARIAAHLQIRPPAAYLWLTHQDADCPWFRRPKGTFTLIESHLDALLQTTPLAVENVDKLLDGLQPLPSSFAVIEVLWEDWFEDRHIDRNWETLRAFYLRIGHRLSVGDRVPPAWRTLLWIYMDYAEERKDRLLLRILARLAARFDLDDLQQEADYLADQIAPSKSEQSTPDILETQLLPDPLPSESDSTKEMVGFLPK